MIAVDSEDSPLYNLSPSGESHSKRLCQGHRGLLSLKSDAMQGTRLIIVNVFFLDER